MAGSGIRTRGAWAGALLIAAGLAWYRLGQVSASILALYPDALPAHPYLVLDHAALLYCLWPATWMGAVAWFLAPGVLIVLATSRRPSVPGVVIRGFLVSAALVSVAGVIAARLHPGAAGMGVGMTVLACLSFAWWLAHGAPVPDEPASLRRVGWLAGLTFVAAAASVPLVFWQDLNPDGGEMLTMARTLDWFVIPRTPAGELSGLGLGMVAQAYVAHVFYLVMGLTEPAARVPVLLYLPVAMAGALATIEAGTTRRFRLIEESWLALAIVLVFTSLAFNSTYHPYSADMASPGGIDLLAGVCLLGMLHAHAEGRWGWTIAFALAGYFARPVAQILCGLLVLGQVAVHRKIEWRVLGALVASAVLCVIVAAAYERGLGSSLHLAIAEPSTGILGRRLRYLSFFDWSRLAYIVVPAGLVPAVALLLFPLQDRLARVWSIAALCFAASLAFVSFTAVHQYLPVVLLALLVFGRMLPNLGRPGAWSAVAILMSALSLWAVLPASFAVDRSTRHIARTVDYELGDYREGREGFSAAFAGKDALLSLFPDYRSLSPTTERVVGPLMLIHYATEPGRPEGVPVNIRVLPAGVEAGAEWTSVSRTESYGVWVRDIATWQAARTTPPSTRFASPVLTRPRASLLPLWGVPAHRYDLDLKAFVNSLRGGRS